MALLATFNKHTVVTKTETYRQLESTAQSTDALSVVRHLNGLDSHVTRRDLLATHVVQRPITSHNDLNLFGALKLLAADVTRHIGSLFDTSMWCVGGDISLVIDRRDLGMVNLIEEALDSNPSILYVRLQGSCFKGPVADLAFCEAPNGLPYAVYQNDNEYTFVRDTSMSLHIVKPAVSQAGDYRWYIDPGNDAVVFLVGTHTFTIPTHLAAALRAKAGQAKILTSGDIKRWFMDVGFTTTISLTIVTPIVCDWLGGPKQVDLIHYMYPTSLPNMDVTSEGKVSATLVCPNPLSLPAYAPVVNESADLAAVHHRLDKIRNHVEPDSFIGYAEEFVHLLTTGHGPYDPLTHDDVLKLQDRPIQQLRNKQAVVQLEAYGKVHVDAFVKKEAYVADKAPRNISNVMVKHNVELSRHSYAFKDAVLKRQHWYMPAKSMTEIAEALSEFHTRHGPVLVETDFSKFDGTISRWLREHVEIASYAAVSPEAASLIRKELDAMATTATGFKYPVDGSRLSGSPVTTDGNTVVAAFVDYVAHREDGFDKQTAYSYIGLHFGDDGVSRNTPSLERVASAMGLSLKCLPKESFIGFLGRIYPDPSTSLCSFQDPVRCWTKLTTLSGNVPEQDRLPRLRSKFRSYLRSDADTPFLGDYLRKWLEEHPGPEKLELTDLPYLHRTAEEWPAMDMPEAARDYILSVLDMTDDEMLKAMTGVRFSREIGNEPGSEHLDGFNMGVAATIITPDETSNGKGATIPSQRSKNRKNFFHRQRGLQRSK